MTTLQSVERRSQEIRFDKTVKPEQHDNAARTDQILVVAPKITFDRAEKNGIHRFCRLQSVRGHKCMSAATIDPHAARDIQQCNSDCVTVIRWKKSPFRNPP